MSTPNEDREMDATAAAAKAPAPTAITVPEPAAAQTSAHHASPLNRTQGGKSFSLDVITAPLESRISEDHLRELQDNARLMMEGGGTATHEAKSSWYSAPIEVQDASESDVKLIAFQPGGFLAVRFMSKVFRFDLVTTITEVLILGVLLLLMWLVLGHAMEPGGSVFGPVVTMLIGTLLGTIIASVLGLPPLVGMLLAGMIWGNLPGGMAQGISGNFYKFLRNVAVAIILARAGLTFKWKLTRPVITNVVFMSMLPQLAEVLAHAGAAQLLFPGAYPSFMFALYQGAAIAASSTAVVIPGVSGMQEKGYSVTRGPGVLMLCSIAFDAVFAVWFTSFVFELVFPEAGEASLSIPYRLLTAPVQIIGGAIVGIVQGLIMNVIMNAFHVRVGTAAEARKEVLEKAARLKSLTLHSCLGIATIFAAYKLGYPGSGTVAVVCCAGTLAFLWGKDPHLDHRRQLLYKDTATLWDSFVMPALFSVVGSTIDVSILANMDMLPPIVGCIAVGLIVKMVGCVAVCSGAGYSWKEKLFLAMGWCAKSTVQAATAGKIIIHVRELAHEGWADDNPDRQLFLRQALAAGELTNTIVVTSILFCAVAGGVAMKVLGPKLLVKEEGVVLSGGH
jgi:Kef-type K+ transport system membrane component KefB